MKPTIKVAIADDHALLRKGLADLIDSFGSFRVIMEAGNGMELIDLLNNAPELPDIGIIDVNMPVMDGFETMLTLRRKWPEIKVLALSMYNNEYTIIRMLRNGALGYLLKNCDPIEFQKALTALADNSYYGSELTSHGGGLPATANITPRELEFLTLCCSELAYKEIAARMGLSSRTVEDHRDNLFKKLKLNSRAGLVMYAMNAGIIPHL